MPHQSRALLFLTLLLLLAACAAPAASVAPAGQVAAPPTVAPLLRAAPTVTAAPTAEREPVEGAARGRVTVDIAAAGAPISPLIYGMSGAPAEVQQAVRPTLASWGGNPSTRYNWRLGNAWNAARDWLYMNTDYGHAGGSASDAFVSEALAGGAEVRIAIPTLGWVAKDSSQSSCSFPGESGCTDAGQASCQNPGPTADPLLTSEPSGVDDAVAWVRHLTETQGYRVRFFAMDNEPELWGITHYDVHPTCTTYEEIRDRYLQYARAVRQAAPEAELLGPVTCCWFFYWNSAAGEADKERHGGQDFLPWFLDEVRAHDQQAGVQTIDVLDIHYYPEGVYNSDADPRTAALRLRSTRSLWDPSYVDESWIAEPIALIPRMRALIERHYPGLRLGISEWNWGADSTMNGALAIADVLGIFGREGVYLASYWRSPEAGSPGMYAFKLYTNYDDQGGRFEGLTTPAQYEGAADIGVFAAHRPESGKLQLMLINRDPLASHAVDLVIGGAPAEAPAQVYRYSQAAPDRIERSAEDAGAPLVLPASSITLVVLETSHR